MKTWDWSFELCRELKRCERGDAEKKKKSHVTGGRGLACGRSKKRGTNEEGQNAEKRTDGDGQRESKKSRGRGGVA